MTRIQLRRDTAANWSTNNPTPSAGEPCFETDTGKLKIGDGTTAYAQLAYFSAGDSGLATSDLSNLTLTGEKHFLNKSQVTNCILEAPNGVATYSGNTITAKQGLKVLIPNGRNTDGTLKNIEYTLSNDVTFTNSANYNSDFYLFIKSDSSITEYGKNVTHIYKYLNERPQPTSNTYVRCYVLETNKWYTSNNGQPYEEQYLAVIGSFGTNNGNTNIRYLDNSNPTQILTYNNKNEISGWAMPSDKYIDLEVGASGAKYTAPANGWFELALRNSTNGRIFFIRIVNDINVYGVKYSAEYNGAGCNGLFPVSKNDVISVGYSDGSVESFRFIYAVGS